MRTGLRTMAAALALLAAAPAGAQALRDFCPSRPGLNTGPCTIDPGHVQVESNAVDWTHDRSADSVDDQVVFGDTLVRIGLGDTTEAQVTVVPYGHSRSRDRATDAITRRGGFGDTTLAIRQNLRNPDGSGTSVALQPFAVLPTGGQAIGAGDWAAGLIVPISFALGEKLTLLLDPEVDAAVDEDRHGRHLAYGGVVSLNIELSEAIVWTVEYARMRDLDPGEHTSPTQGSMALTWNTSENDAVYANALAGLNHAAPGLELYVGVAHRF